ncbi:glycosyltransferase [Candidatus Nanohaloarchaea archaeon]|nr:glycosyltransferase [Candidatus Nanohaloarchaea archaeon]
MDRKILMLGWGFPPKIEGGLDIHVAHLFEELRKKDIDVDLALPEEYAPAMNDVTALETESEHILPQSREISSKVAELAKDYDIVHTHDWFGSEAGLKSKKYSGVKWVSTLHSLSSQRSRSTNEEGLKLERAAAEKSDTLITVSNKLAEEVKSEFNTSAQVIHNGFSSKKKKGRDMKEELGIENNMIFFVGRHAEQKGLEHLLYGFKKFLEEEDGVLVLGGEGHMSEALQDFAEILGIDEKVLFPGFIPEGDLGDYYSSADVFVSPSLNEPFGLTLTEALEHQTPVVAAESGAEEILPDNTIIKVEPDSSEISAGISEALDKEISSIEGRSWEEVAEETLEVYRDL